jgi:plasmid stability protein
MNEQAEFRALSVRLPEDLHAHLRASAAAHERSWGGEVRAIVKAHLTKSAPDRGVPEARRPAGDNGMTTKTGTT